MQFVLAMDGHRVINVDPGVKAGGLGWEVDPDVHKWLCKRLGTSVEVIAETLVNAGLQDATADVIVCVSALEHFSSADLESTAVAIRSILKPSGLAVFTVDCFLDLAPFTDLQHNVWGRNIAINEFLRTASLELVSGNPAELHGFPKFNTEYVLKRLPELHVSRDYPCLAQCFTAAFMNH